MTAFDFCTPTEYVFGPDVESRAGELILSRMGVKKVLIVSGSGSAERSGLLGRIRQSLDAAGVAYASLSGIQPNPTVEEVRRGIDICRQEAVEGVLAVGGGSAIDAAKAMAAGAPYAGDFWDFWTGKQRLTEALPIGVVLTIAAAGSEGSGNSVITNSATGQKISLRTNILRPRFSLLNPALTVTLPPYQTACGITDMMAHIMERYFSNTPDCQVTDRLCEGLLQAIIEEAPKVMAAPDDYQARANLMWAGTMAHNGICGVGRQEEWTCHGMEHELSALDPRIAHGAGLAVVFPAWLSYVAERNPSKVEQFAQRVFGLNGAAAGIAALRSFYRSIGMPQTLGELGLSEADIPRLVAGLHAIKGNPCGTYVSLTEADTAAIYRLML